MKDLATSRSSSPSFTESTFDESSTACTEPAPIFPSPAECARHQRENLARIQREEDRKIQAIYERATSMIKKAMEESLTLPIQAYIPYELQDAARLISPPAAKGLERRPIDEHDPKIKLLRRLSHDLERSGWTMEVVLDRNDIKLFIYSLDSHV